MRSTANRPVQKNEQPKKAPVQEPDSISSSPKDAAQRLLTLLQTTEHLKSLVVDTITPPVQKYIDETKSMFYGTVYWTLGTRRRVEECEQFLLAISNLNRDVIINEICKRFANPKGGWGPTSVNTNLMYALIDIVPYYFEVDPNPRESVEVSFLIQISKAYVKKASVIREKKMIEQKEKAKIAAKGISSAAKASDAYIAEKNSSTARIRAQLFESSVQQSNQDKLEELRKLRLEEMKSEVDKSEMSTGQKDKKTLARELRFKLHPEQAALEEAEEAARKAEEERQAQEAAEPQTAQQEMTAEHDVIKENQNETSDEAEVTLHAETNTADNLLQIDAAVAESAELQTAEPSEQQLEVEQENKPQQAEETVVLDEDHQVAEDQQHAEQETSANIVAFATPPLAPPPPKPVTNQEIEQEIKDRMQRSFQASREIKQRKEKERVATAKAKSSDISKGKPTAQSAARKK